MITKKSKVQLKDSMKHFLSHFIVALGAFASIMTMVSFFFDIKWGKDPCLPWIVIAFIIVVCLLYAFSQISRKKKVGIRIAENFQLTVEEGNLFDKKGVIVIPVNDYFDTHVGDGVIDSKSVHGQFINRLFQNRLTELDNKIKESISQLGISGTKVPPRINGKDIKYPLGTCADVQDGGNRYVCVVTTEFDQDNIARLKRSELSRIIDGLIDHLEKVAGKDMVSMPVIGSGNARLNRSAERILHYLIDYFDFSLSEKKILGGLHIIIRSRKEINLNRIERIFDKKNHE